MKLLAIETSGKMCGVCFAEDTHIIDELELNNGLTHSESLMPLIKDLLDKNNLKIPDLDAFVCDIGPGSFTGIRIGVATVKAFIDSYEKTLFTGVSSLEALAYNCSENGIICSIIDAKNDNCYFALYSLDNNNYFKIISPTSASYNEMFEILKQYSNTSITFVGDGAISNNLSITQHFKNAKFLSDPLNNIKTSNLAIAGFNKISSNNTLDLSPMYLKKPQAERILEEKMKKD